jgi:hypothetical protein
MKKLPIGIQSFSEIRNGGYVYVDKTELVHRMVTMGKPYFLSRPRRFGKSLLVSTLKELFEGNKALFEGLWIEAHWDWEQRHPVLHFSFDAMDYEQSGLESALSRALDGQAKRLGLELSLSNYKARFNELITAAHEKYGQVVLLIDEYDKPIIDYLSAESIAQAKANRDILREFYGIIKSADTQLRLVFITGITKFSKVSIFSHLNNLNDLTLDRNYATLTGYTQQELEHYFESHLEATRETLGISMEVLLEHMRIWYNGYSWDGKARLYNPFGILNFLSKQQFTNFWFATGSPNFLIEQMRERQLFAVENMEVSSIVFEQFDLDYVAPVSLLFHAGYLTVKSVDVMTGEYVLDYPNKEVRESMYQFLIDELAPEQGHRHTGRTIRDMRQAFNTGDLEQVRRILDSMLAGLPYETFDKKSEGLYHGLVHIIFNYLGIYADSETHSSRGRADVIVQTPDTVYIFEFKFGESAEAAVAQIRERAYADRFRSSGKRMFGIGVSFDAAQRAIGGWVVEEL